MLEGARVLVLYASVGGGHGSAANAVAAALRELAPAVAVETADLLDFTNRAFRHLYGKAYFQVYAKAPHLLGYLYDRLDKAGEAKGGVAERLRRVVQKANLKKFDAFLRSGRWDVIVNTHFLPADILAGLKKRGEVRVPQITVVTDFEAHRLWVNEPTDFYCVASPEARSTLRHVGVSPARVRVTGIPIAPVFALPFDKRDLRRNLGFPEGRPLVLQLAGGLGVGPVESVHRALLNIRIPLSVVVVTGTNAYVAERLRSVPNPSRHAVRVLGFTREMERWMGAADLVISKPGGLTSSECLARGVPMAIVHPIPGQESRNSDYLLEAGAAVKINDLSVLTHKLARLLFSPARLANLADNARRAARPWAAFEVAEKALELARGRLPVAVPD
ncbi:MAG: UDP-N-acetylglucosamine--LPS N-acetylglucosamine transferase [Elusimicrobia bacterium]|nr:UDP-N-acetylglucosamine--LPS N-acetylglucosamine transferase [Elusimicrobiota bacterium]